MPDLREQLENTLRPRYEILRELGGGGMSRVFLARETELGRDVVIKVLPPELAGVNVGRFRREIQTAAKLHHPHIVPLHAAGDAGGVLFYTMPFVEGETLRGRIGGRQDMPLDDVMRIMRDVADALAYAHQQQVVHRDIKPENVLLSSGHALVTDFGVAKALSVSTEATDSSLTLGGTAGGLAMGTPAYMAPEQAAGDPGTDHRADLYALGLLGYEMLAGRPPFSRGSAHEVIAAHIAERPAPIDTLRPDAPPLLAALIMRCIEKRPDDRPPSAAVVREQLDAMRTPSGGAIRAASRRRRFPKSLVAAAIVAPAIASLLLLEQPEARTLDRDVVAVAPFSVTGGSSLGYLREGMLDLFAAKLTGEGGPRAADPRAVLQQWRSAGGSDTARLSRESALRVAERLGAGQLLDGDVAGSPERLTISAHLIDVASGRMRADAQVSGPADSLPQLIDALTLQLLAINAGEGGRLATLTSTSLPALRAYLSGMWQYRRGRYKAAGAELSRAVALDSTFALAALGLMQATSWYGAFDVYAKAGKAAWASRERLSARDRAMLVAHLGPRYPRQSSSAEMIAAAMQYRDRAPDRADAWFQLGDQLIHNGWLIGNTAAHPQAENAFRQAIAIDSTYAPALEHLVLLAARRGDTAATRRYATMYLRSDSAGESAVGIRWRLAAATGDARTADSIAAIRQPLPPTSNSIISWVGIEDGVRVAQSHALLQSIGEREIGEGQFGSWLMLHDAALMMGRPAEAREFLSHFEREVGPAPREALKVAIAADANPAVADSAAASLRGQLAQPRPRGPVLGAWTGTQCIVPLWNAFGRGDVAAARAAVPRLQDVARDSVPIAEYAAVCALLLDGVVAVAERAPDVRQRVLRADSAMKSGPANPTQEFGNVVVSRLFESIGDRQGALSAIRRRGYFLGRKPAFASMLRAEGRLAAGLGDTQGAIAAYRLYLALRENPEPSVAPEVQQVRAELRRLERGSGG